MIKKSVFLLLISITFQAQAAVNKAPVAILQPVKEIIQTFHKTCVPLLLQYDLMEMQQNNQPLPTQEEFTKTLQATIKSYNNQIDKLSIEKKNQLKTLLKKFTTMEDLHKIFVLLYGKEDAEILMDFLPQIAQQQLTQTSMLKQAIEAVKKNVTFLKFLQEKAIQDFEFVQAATPEEVEKAQAMLEDSDAQYIAMFNAVVIDFFKQT